PPRRSGGARSHPRGERRPSHGGGRGHARQGLRPGGLPPPGPLMPQPVELVSERVTLSIPGEADIDRIAEVCSDPAIARWTTVPSPYRRENAVGFVGTVVPDGWASGRLCVWAIRTEGVLAGMISIGDIRERRGEIGFWLAPEFRGRGVMSEATRLAVEYAFRPRP